MPVKTVILPTKDDLLRLKTKFIDDEYKGIPMVLKNSIYICEKNYHVDK